MKKILNNIKGLSLMVFFTKIFKPESVLKGKRVAIIGAADSAFKDAKGDFINDFDFVIRLNKAPHSLTPDKFSYVGNRTDILFHSFYENTSSGGGAIDQRLYAEQELKFLINPYNYFSGLIAHLNFYKRNLNRTETYVLSRSFYTKMTQNFGKWIPTVGYAALYSVLNAQCREVYITGFTFFRTPYADDYRNQLKDMEANKKHIQSQGLHNPDVELREFIKQLDLIKEKDTIVILDETLDKIVQNNR